MKKFMDGDFLLDNPAARTLYEKYACGAPIYDYHNHLSPADVASGRSFRDLTELWLETDHYKWRAMRACGIDERYITGDASPKEKFDRWASVLPKLPGSPLYHWTHLELRRYFGIDDLLCPATADKIWKLTSEMMRSDPDRYSAPSLLRMMNVKVICTTDDPVDSLVYHRAVADQAPGFAMLPSFRPDRYLAGEPAAVAAARESLCREYGKSDIRSALSAALDRFESLGCRVSDHGFSVFGYREDPDLRGLLDFLAGEYAGRGMVMQLHLGPIRNNSPKLMSAYGRDAGGDSVGRLTDPFALSEFLSGLEERDRLPKTVLYNLNPCDNRMMSTMAGNFAPKVQFGAAWWFNDTLRGMRDQIRELMETGGLSASVGMLTDSRSFTSFVRHEYYRRILCSELGSLVEEGLYPCDTGTLGEIVSDVCWRNAARFIFGGRY